MTLINTNDSFWCTTIITKYRTNSTQHIHTKKGLGLAIIQVYQNANCSSSYINIWGVLSTYSITKKKGPTLACYLPADLIAAIYLFLCLFGLGLDWLSVGGGGVLVATLSFELGCALPTVGLFAWPSLAACKHKHKHNNN